MNATDTPRTDEEAWTPKKGAFPVVDAEFARDLERELAEARKAISEVTRERTQERCWIPVGERQPREGEKVLACWSDGWMYIAFFNNGEWWNSLNRAIPKGQDVAYWMPLPEAPK